MIYSDACISQILSPVRTIKARVELLEGSTLLHQFCYQDALKSFTIDRTGEGKFFGFGICQRLNVHLRDVGRELDISTAHNLDVSFGAGYEYIYPFPNFYVSEVHRDETTNELSITAYDALAKAAEHTVAELGLNNYTIREFATACATLLGLPLVIEGIEDDGVFDTFYPNGANFEGTETIREALNDVAEATQTIYYINHNWELVFKRMDSEGEPVLTIDNENYINLTSKTNRRLARIVSANELGDNVESQTTGLVGTAQYVRDNAFWELREDIATVVDNALAAVNGFTINQFDCSWRGNFLLEIGDKIGLITKDGQTMYSYVLDDTIKYDGAFSQKTQWEYEGDEAENAENPTSLGDILKQTYAKVDKQKRQIELVASEQTTQSEAISKLSITTGNISTMVSQNQNDFNNALSDVEASIQGLNTALEQTAKDLNVSINRIEMKDTERVITTTGFRFDENGLNVSKSGSQMETTITEDGMTVYKDNDAVLTANNEGVEAIDLRARTFLIIGKNSRLEDYQGNRTACFWIGG